MIAIRTDDSRIYLSDGVDAVTIAKHPTKTTRETLERRKYLLEKSLQYTQRRLALVTQALASKNGL
jgi:serine/threonine protein phosphatase PrpC